MLQMVSEYLKDKKISALLAVLLVGGTLAGFIWINATFVSEAEAQQDRLTLSKQINANGTLIRSHIDDYKIDLVKRDIQTVRDQQYDLTVMIDQNGQTALSRKRTTELNNRLMDLNTTKQCLTNGGTNCK